MGKSMLGSACQTDAVLIPRPRCKGNRVYALLWQPKTPCSVVNLRPLYPSDLSMHKHLYSMWCLHDFIYTVSICWLYLNMCVVVF